MLVCWFSALFLTHSASSDTLLMTWPLSIPAETVKLNFCTEVAYRLLGKFLSLKKTCAIPSKAQEIQHIKEAFILTQYFMPSIIVYAVIWKQQLATSPQNYKKKRWLKWACFLCWSIIDSSLNITWPFKVSLFLKSWKSNFCLNLWANMHNKSLKCSEKEHLNFLIFTGNCKLPMMKSFR